MTGERTYRTCVVGLSGIGAGRPLADGDHGLGYEMPHSHVTAYAHLPFTELAGVCDLQVNLIQDALKTGRAPLPVYGDLRTTARCLKYANPIF